MSSIADNYERIVNEVQTACLRSGRQASEVRLMAVTKNQPWEKMDELYKLGHRLFGENRVPEAWEKRQKLPKDGKIHMIGQLQSNKAREALFFDGVQSVDRSSLALELEKRLAVLNRTLPVLLEVNTGGEDQKAGIRRWEELSALAILVHGSCPHLKVEGLMTMAPFTQDERVLRSCFRTLRNWRDQLRLHHSWSDWSELSMGMSNDFIMAVEEGSTMVRVGTKLFED